MYLKLIFIFRCGLVSLWMAGQFLQPENEVTVQEIYEQATKSNFTKHGENNDFLDL